MNILNITHFLSFFPIYVFSNRFKGGLIPAQVQEFTGIDQLFHLWQTLFLWICCDAFTQDDVRPKGGEQCSQHEQFQTHPHTPWHDVRQK